jgi:hypothetical protein
MEGKMALKNNPGKTAKRESDTLEHSRDLTIGPQACDLIEY